MPYYRLQRGAIGAALGSGGGKGTRAVASFDEDTTSMGVEAARLAIAYRQRFKLDYLIDLVGYRKYGHNEGDEPAFTQPQLFDVGFDVVGSARSSVAAVAWGRLASAAARSDGGHS